MSHVQFGEVLLEATDVACSLGGRPILEGVSFTVRDRMEAGRVTGQIACFLGPSGVGKTRLLRLLAGLDDPRRGTIRGRNGQPLAVGDVGLVFQDYPVVAHRTVEQNLGLAARIAGLSRAVARERTADLLERFHLAHRAGGYPAELSGGERQRLAVAQALVARRWLLLFDEPWSGLDPCSLDAVSELLASVAHERQENTLLIVTHDVHAALSIADTIYLLGRPEPNKGARIVAHYDLDELGVRGRPGGAAARGLAEELRGRFATL